VLRDELGRVLMDARRAFWRGRLEMDPERVRWWHGAIFARHFPHDGGRFRRERAFFGVVTDGGGMRQIEGSTSHVLRQISRRYVPRSTPALSSSIGRASESLSRHESSPLSTQASSTYTHLLTGITALLLWRFRPHCGRWGSPLSNSRITKT
jgi:hypothetical protein